MSDAPEPPPFDAPWKAQAFAMVVHLHDQGTFTWSEWAATLSSEIHGPVERDYSDHWLAALERIVAEKGLASSEALGTRRDDWLAAAARTPHGDPIEL